MHVSIRAIVVVFASLALVVAPACDSGTGTGSGGEPDTTTGGGGGDGDTSGDSVAGGTTGDDATTGGGDDGTSGSGGDDDATTGGGDAEEDAGAGGDDDATTGGGDAADDTGGGGSDDATTGGGDAEEDIGGDGADDATGGGGDAVEDTGGGGGEEDATTTDDSESPLEDTGTSDAGPTDDDTGGPDEADAQPGEDVPPVVPDSCGAVGQTCETEQPQPAPYLCHGAGNEGFCTVACETTDDGTNDCDDGQHCSAAPGQAGLCVVSSCTGTFFNSDCAPGTVCIPDATGLGAPGTCFLVGDGEAGSACEAIADCGPDTICIGGTCLEMGCESLSGNVTCPDGLDCMTIISVATGEAFDVGYCKDNCVPFVEDSGCAAGEVCSPNAVDNVSGVWGADCIESGDGLAGPGQTCIVDSEVPQTTCASGLVCFEGACAEVCDAYIPGACGEGQSCTPWINADDDGNIVGNNDFGFCQEGCTPFTEAGQCGAGELCYPYSWGPANGACDPGGDLGAGEDCDPAAEVPGCGEGLYCNTMGDNSTCVPFCDASGKAGAAGDTSAADEFCNAFGHTNPDGSTLDTELGYCHPGCDFHADTACTDEQLECYMNELGNVGVDFCAPAWLDPWPVAELAPCPAGTEALDYCGPNSICLANQFAGPGLHCYDICLSTTEPFGVSEHADCRRDTAVCEDVFASEVLGLCGQDDELSPPNPECPTAVIQVQEGEEVIPQTKLHLVGSNSYAVGSVSAWQWSVTQPDGSQSVFLPSAAHPDPTFEVNIAGVYDFTLEVWDQDGKKSCEPAEVTVFVIPDEAVHVELLWDTPGDLDQTDEGPEAGADLDLHFLHPFATGEDVDGNGVPDGWFDQPFDCFWFNAHPNWGSLDPFVDDDPGLDRDDTDGSGPENVNLNLPEDGMTYKVGVHYWNDHDFGPSTATVRIYVFSQLVFEVSDVSLVEGDMWEVATLSWPSAAVTLLQTDIGDYVIIPNYSHPFFPLP